MCQRLPDEQPFHLRQTSETSLTDGLFFLFNLLYLSTVGLKSTFTVDHTIIL